MDILTTFMTAPLAFLWEYAVPFVLVLSVLVFVHEWGHYIIARLCGVRVETFSIGFGRELFGRTDKNGTRWKFSLIPLGGYVMMFGDTDPTSASHQKQMKEEGKKARKYTAAEKKVAFFTQPIWKRASIVFAGPAINFLFAIVLLTGLYMTHGQPYTPPVAATIIEGSPADRAGVQPDDKVLAINGEEIDRFQDIVQAVAVNLNTEMTFDVVHYLGDRKWSDQVRTITITPEIIEDQDRFGFRHSRGRIGIMSPSGEGAIQDHTFWSAFVGANVETWRLTTSTLKAVGQMITGTRSAEELGGILRIGAYAGEFAQAGIISLITFSALLSINLGLINLFPIPLLDGGHLAFYAAEAVRGRPIGENAQEYALRFGFVLVLGLMLFSTWNDLVQLRIVDYVLDLVS